MPMTLATRLFFAAMLFAVGVVMMAMFRESAFIARDRQSLTMVCLGALLDSTAIAVLTWPKVSRRRAPSRVGYVELAKRLDEIR
jgi:hypothetical protein